MHCVNLRVIRLRALLIQIGVKLIMSAGNKRIRLRALLIQIGVKHDGYCWLLSTCLRALLIQIGVKLLNAFIRVSEV